MALELPVGPSRLRASDADRERVVAFVRGDWSQGRLTDAEFEQRLGCALQARELGDSARRAAWDARSDHSVASSCSTSTIFVRHERQYAD
ncbi:MAG: DUF1707 SHOCT-like domain-containing protein, partial [Solirubrobacteraceae bacterium]